VKAVALAYLALATVAAGWALYIDVALFGSQREHLLPDLLLTVCGLPTSLLLDLLYSEWPELLNGLAQTAFLTACALGQSGLLAVLVLGRKRRAKV